MLGLLDCATKLTSSQGENGRTSIITRTAEDDSRRRLVRTALLHPSVPRGRGKSQLMGSSSAGSPIDP
jgi:hypothetical protein